TGKRIGIVNAIAGYVHADVVVHGRGDHAGATPMDLRLDPTLPLAETVAELERLARAAGKGTVGTVGEIEVEPGIINAIASRVRLAPDGVGDGVAAIYGLLAGALFGAMAVAIRVGLRQGGDAEGGAAVLAAVAAATAVVLAAAARGEVDPGELWPFALAGLLV